MASSRHQSATVVNDMQAETRPTTMQMGSPTSKQGHNPHFCLFGSLHLTAAMKLLLGIGLLAVCALCALEALYFRRSLFVMIIPAGVIVISTVAIAKRNPRFLWPIIGISFFHLFLDAYLTLIFLFFFIFKPLYIIMVLNWAYNTTHTAKTASYYATCAAIFAALLLFFLFNLCQLRLSFLFQNYLEELLVTSSSATSNTSVSRGESSSSENDAENSGPYNKGSGKNNAAPEAHLNANYCCQKIFGSGNARGGGEGGGYVQLQQCKVLNEPPIVFLHCNNNHKMLLCPSPAFSQRGGGGGGMERWRQQQKQNINNMNASNNNHQHSLGQRRAASLDGARQFGTR